MRLPNKMGSLFSLLSKTKKRHRMCPMLLLNIYIYIFIIIFNIFIFNNNIGHKCPSVILDNKLKTIKNKERKIKS